MRRLLKAELNTIYRKPKLYVFLLILVVLFIAGIIANIFNSEIKPNRFEDALYPLFAILIIVDISHKEYKYKTMKNLIGSGFSRTTIYFGKFITAIIVSIAFIIFNKVCEIISDVIVKDPITFTTDEMLKMVRSLGMYAIIFILCMLIISDGLSLLAAVIYSIFGELIIFMLEMFSVLSPVALKRISLVLLLTSDPKGLDKKVLVNYPWLWNGLGIILAIILLIAGLEIFKRKEFK